MANISFEGFKADDIDSNSGIVQKNPVQSAPMLTSNDMTSIGNVGLAGMYGSHDAVSPFVGQNPNSNEECLNTMQKMYESYMSVVSTYVHEKQEVIKSLDNLHSVQAQCERDVEVARINADASVATAQASADAAVEQSYNNLLSVRAQCEKEVELAKIELEKFQKKYDMCMKVLNDAQGNFEMQLEALGIILKNLMEGKEKIWKMIDDDKELKNADKYFSQLNASNASILELSKRIADLKPVYNSLPGIN